MKIPAIFDVDTGVDDAVALIWAIASGKFDIKFISTCSGNTSVDNSTKNTLNILEMINAPQIDVVRGSENGYKRTRTTRHVHGKNGLGDYHFPKNNRTLCPTNFLDKYIDVLSNSQVPINIVVLGPLTNIAHLLDCKPEIAKKIKRIFFMGGSLDKIENNTPYASFNVACDPEAVERVLQAKVPITFVPNNLGKTYFLTPLQLERLSYLNNVGKTILEMNKNYHDYFVKLGLSMYDSTTIFSVMYPQHTKQKNVFVDVKYFSELDTGIVIPHFNTFHTNAKLVVNLNGKKFFKKFFKTMKKLH